VKNARVVKQKPLKCLPLICPCPLLVFLLAYSYHSGQMRDKDSSLTDHKFMELAVEEALQASREGEVPVGAVLVSDGGVVARDHNRCISSNDPTAHAEILVLRAGASRIGNYRLNGCELYVTIEPCLMCAGAIVHSRISRLIFGARDEKGGAVESLYHILEDARLNHRVEVTEGVLAERCQEIMQAFFSARRE
jgi:tRNA(adenine34) deaminase